MLFLSHGVEPVRDHTVCVVSQQDKTCADFLGCFQQWKQIAFCYAVMLWTLTTQVINFAFLGGSTFVYHQLRGNVRDKFWSKQPDATRQGWTHRMVWALVLLHFIHGGEASNPGPTDRWTLGTFNPSGLNGKQQIISEHLGFGDIWAISETHLSSRAFQSFKRGLFTSESEFTYCVGGHHAPPRPRSDHVGAWTGVAMLSKHPTRAIPVVWSPDVYQSSRVQVTATLCNNLWITGGVVYGEPPGQLHLEARENTETLVSAVFDAVTATSGLRFIAGDFNFQTDQLDVFKLLQQQGFRDLQDIAWERWAAQPQFTCKGKTRKDFCYISPELQVLLVDVIIQHDIWPDHSVLAGVFQGSPKDIVRHWWRQPMQLQWPDEFCNSQIAIDVHWDEVDPTEGYQHMWSQIESSAGAVLYQAGKPLLRNQTGRGATLDTVLCKGQRCVQKLKKGRMGDIPPTFQGTSVKHAQWFRQLRRLQCYVRYRRCHEVESEDLHGVQLWRSILCAKGFPIGFQHWWEHECKTHLVGTPATCPIVAPPLELAQPMYESFAIEVRALERLLGGQAKARAKKLRETDGLQRC